ncbi:MAG: efflux RND transporter periplasmic adaptor subunit, partial [Desulfobacterales bacterium]
LSRQADLGSHVSAGQNLGRLAGTDVFRVEATVPVSSLNRLSFPEKDGNDGSKVRIRNRSAWDEGVYRTGRLHRLVGELDEKTRLARVIAHVDDPLALEKSGAPPLIINSIVQVRISGRPVKDVIRINRDYVRKDNTVWVMKGEKLDIRDPEIVFKDPEYVYIKEGIEDGEQVVTSSLATVAQGARLRQKDDGKGGGPGKREEDAGNRDERQGGTDR